MGQRPPRRPLRQEDRLLVVRCGSGGDGGVRNILRKMGEPNERDREREGLGRTALHSKENVLAAECRASGLAGLTGT